GAFGDARGDGDHPASYEAGDKRSGYAYAGRDSRTMQDDDDSNPGFLWVEQGRDLWTRVEGEAGKSCASCHGPVERMKGVGATYPRWVPGLNRPVNLEQRINMCRTGAMKASKWAYESDPLLAMTALIGLQSRGMPVNVDVSGPMQPWLERGKASFFTRVGQYDFACSHCHVDHLGRKMRSAVLSQGQSNGFPTYRLKWQKIGSLHRRIAGCNEDVYAEPYPLGSDEYLALEIYMADRARGLPVETPSVRR
ncbi:MAG: sulfur oxidation c-type cytochrome SoxA, partial [Alphaproteobacteria bacterium]